MDKVSITPVSGRRDLEAFVALPYALHRHDPCFAPPLRGDVRALLDPAWRGRAVDALLYRRIWEKGGARGFDWAEAGWVLEDNHAMLNGLEHMGFRAYKRYRIYERAL